MSNQAQGHGRSHAARTSSTRALLIARDALAEIEARARGGGWVAVARIARAALKASLKASRSQSSETTRS